MAKRGNVYQQINRNKQKTILLMMVFIAIVLAIGYIGGVYYAGDAYAGLFFAGMVALVMTLFSYFGGDSVSLMSAGAKKIEKHDSPYLWNMVENLAITAGMPMPNVYVIEDQTMNAFATGRNPEKASVAFTTGIINGLENEELEGVVAHELSHIQNYDTRLMMVVVVLVGVIALFTDWMFHMHWFGGGRRSGGDRRGGQLEIILMVVGVALIVLSPIIAELIKLAISRKREYLADASAVLLTRYADGLAGALRKIGAQDSTLRRANHATAHLYISHPFGSKKRFSKLFSTHPPIEERIAALKQMSR